MEANRLKIALIMKYYSLRRGGGEFDLVRLSRALADRGHEVHLCLHGWDEQPDPRLVLHPLPMQSWWAPAKILSFARAWQRLCAQEEFDVTHAMTQVWPADIFWNGGGLHATWLQAMRPGLTGWFAHANPRHLANAWVERRILRPGGCRHVVLLAERDREILQTRFGVSPQRIHVIPNGIDPARCHPGYRQTHRVQLRGELGLRDDTVLMVMAGSDWKRKGLAPLLQALAALRRQGVRPWKLAVLGNDRPRRWQLLANRLGLGARVLFPGRAEEIGPWYGAADAVVLASLHDGYGNVVPEALACGAPVLCTTRTGASFLVRDRETGWIIDLDARTPALVQQSYWEALTDLLANSDLVAMGAAAAASASWLTWDWTVDRLEKLYWRIATDKGNPEPR